MTAGNGSEFVYNYKLADTLAIPTYFADPYSAYQRGTNDHFNGRIRGCLRKDTSLDDVTQEEFDDYAKEINNRPSTVWGWLNPAEVFHEQCS